MNCECRRVVITGLGAVTPIGGTAETFWEAVKAGKNGISLIENFDASQHAVRFGGEIKDFEATEWMTPKQAKTMDRFSHFAVAGARQAIEDSGLDLDSIDRDRAGVVLGSGIGGLLEIEKNFVKMQQKGPRRVSPRFIPNEMMNAASGNVAIIFGLRGPNYVVASACASSTHSTGLAFREIRYGSADIMITGGTEAALTALGLAGFCSAKALSTRNDDPAHASRPFDKDRNGFVLGEGGGALVLEELEHALRRGAKIYAELLGMGSTDDAFHITQPVEGGEGAAKAMLLAVQDGGIEPSQINYINAHGTSTYHNDRMETAAIRRAFGEHADKLVISSTKSQVGHLLGGAGAVELIATVRAVHDDIAPPTINYETPDPDCDLDYVPNEARPMEINYALSNSFGFGGHNACLLVGKYNPDGQ
ncbi:MAG: beta-ketoacyl-[acyl-carrier-protein] synthase II [Planctomycetota bacterium]|nr:MAG: beta-ketoacyl-[acyl-carrier-protein] synthase II [Planctomycetota bacterium]